MAEIKKIYIDDIAKKTQAMLQRAVKKHKSVNAYCIFVEGDYYHVLVPTYVNEDEEQKAIRKMIDAFISCPEGCKAFAKIVIPPARYFERQEKKQRKQP